MKTVQYFSDEYLKECQKMTLEQRLEFLENFREITQNHSPSKLISIKIPENLLNSFKIKCSKNNLRYQTQIKKLMAEWLQSIS